MAMYVVKEQFGRYETVDTIADGAMGSVVLARDRLLDRMVAIKTVKLQGISDPMERQRLCDALARESQLVQVLAHPNIVSVHDVFEEEPGSPPSLVMEYIQGTTLAALLKGGSPLPLDFAIPVATQIANALDHAHTMGVVHGDIKPSNILIADDSEQAKLVDFGIARLMNGDSRVESRLMGTARYVAPELLLRQDIDHRSDLFSLGVVLYEMLLGCSPFAGQTPEEIAQEIINGSANLSAESIGVLPEHLQIALRKSLAKDPSFRVQSARQLAGMLGGSDAGQADGGDPTATTQDLSELVVPDLPGLESSREAPAEEVPVEPVPTPASPPDERTFSSQAATSEPLPWRRWAAIAGLTTGFALVIGLFILWSVTPRHESGLRFSEMHKVRLQLVPLLKEGQRLLQSGEPEVAARVFERAEELAPGYQNLTELRKAAQQAAADLADSRHHQAEIQALIEQSRSALRVGSPRRALKLATEVLSIEPENVEAQALAEAAAASIRSSQASPPVAPRDPPERSAVQQEASQVPAASFPAPRDQDRAPIRMNTPRRQAAPAAMTGPASLRVDLFTYLPKGVLTIYAGEEQVLLQPFRFVEKSGLMRKKKTAGRLETSIQLTAGPTDFRIYIASDGQETQSVNISAELRAGDTHVLRLMVAENGTASAQVN